MTSCGSYNNRRLEVKYHFHHRGKKNQQAKNNASSNYFVPSSQIIFTLMMEAILSSEMYVVTRATRHHIQ
jgi:hypothetical protein